jgi:hypothetical protein
VWLWLVACGPKESKSSEPIPIGKRLQSDSKPMIGLLSATGLKPLRIAIKGTITLK